MATECCVTIEVPPPKVKRVSLVAFRGIELGFKIGRGYSLGELKEAGLNYKIARQLNIPIDLRRRSAHKENVENLKRFLEQVKELVDAKKAKPARIVIATTAQQ
ncbi:MAG: ribosomal protein L13e [Ignisphaera sp.]